jgi:hypothetical protein
LSLKGLGEARTFVFDSSLTTIISAFAGSVVGAGRKVSAIEMGSSLTGIAVIGIVDNLADGAGHIEVAQDAASEIQPAAVLTFMPVTAPASSGENTLLVLQVDPLSILYWKPAPGVMVTLP